MPHGRRPVAGGWAAAIAGHVRPTPRARAQSRLRSRGTLDRKQLRLQTDEEIRSNTDMDAAGLGIGHVALDVVVDRFQIGCDRFELLLLSGPIGATRQHLHNMTSKRTPFRSVARSMFKCTDLRQKVSAQLGAMTRRRAMHESDVVIAYVHAPPMAPGRNSKGEISRKYEPQHKFPLDPRGSATVSPTIGFAVPAPTAHLVRPRKGWRGRQWTGTMDRCDARRLAAPNAHWGLRAIFYG